MSRYNDNGFKAAQRAYDNQLPPDNDDVEVTCPDCVGEGTVCGDDITDTPEPCPKCKGSGEITLTPADIREINQQRKIDELD